MFAFCVLILTVFCDLVSVSERSDISDIPFVGWLTRSTSWLCNIVVYGGLIYWSVTLFGLRIVTQPFHIESTISRWNIV